jgi:hypothetical protein
MNKSVGPSQGARRPALVVGTLVAVSLVVAACGGTSPAAAKTTAATTSTTATTTSTTAASPAAVSVSTTVPTATPGARTGRTGAATSFAPAASGTIASILGQSLEVQGANGQTTVNLTAKTAITATVAVALKEITKGTCISATGTKGTGGKVDATLITIEPSVKGACTGRGGFGGGGGIRGGPGGAFPGRPTGSVPTTRSRAPTNVAGAFGKVLSLSGQTITIQGISFAGFGGRPTTGTSRPTRTTTPKTSRETVVVSSKTKYSKTERVTYHALKVGECATAFGGTNDIGVVTATRLTVTQPTGGSCTAGSGFGRGGFGGAAGAAAGATS